MKKLFQVIFPFVIVLVFVNAKAEMLIDTEDIPLSRCVGYPGFFDAWKNYADWSEKSWKLENRAQADWAPNQAGVQIRSDLKGFYEIVVRFQMSRTDVSFFNTLAFKNTATKVPMGLEVDIIDYANLFGVTGENDFSIIDDNLPASARLMQDVSALDGTKQLSALIIHPGELEHDKLYEIVFQPNGAIASGKTGGIRMVWQVSANYKWITAMRNDKSSKCDLMATVNYMFDAVLAGRDDIGLDMVSSYYDDSIPDDAQDGWYYFTAAPGDVSNMGIFTTGSGKSSDIMCWDDDRDPEHDQSDSNRCDGYGGQNLFRAPLGLHYQYDASPNITQAIISTEGHLTHIIHPDYRCSNNLCWAPGGDTNCYDAHTHYEIRNGDITDIVKDNLDKYQMCAEVYSDRNVDDDGDGFTENQGDMDDYDASIHPAGNSEGSYGNGPYNTDPKDGTQYPVTSVSDSEQWSDGTNKVGFDYMKSGSKSHDDWDGSEQYREDKIPNDEDFRIKLKKKNDRWPSEKACVQLYFSNNKYFSIEDDRKIGYKECDRFDVDDDRESVYLEDVDLPRSKMYPGRNYYVFARITDEDGNLLDVSSRTDSEEYVKIDVYHLRNDVLATVTHNALNGIGPRQNFTATATVRNLLDETKEDVALKLWFLGKEQVVNLGKMGPGQVVTRSFTLTAPESYGSFDIVALCEPLWKVHETNKENNRSVSTVTVKDPPVTSKFSVSSVVGDVPLTVSFNNGTTGFINNRTWYFGDESVSHELNPTHTYNEAGIYTVTLVSSNHSYRSIKKITVTANEPVPPDTDGDGIPDESEQSDIDGDGILDYQESWFVDSDKDGVNDQLDGANDDDDNDSDNDGFTNWEEKVENTDPLDATSVPLIHPEPFTLSIPQGFQFGN